MTFPLHATLFALTLCLALPTRADTISDAIAAAATAYDAGDLATTSAQLNQAAKDIATQQSTRLLAQFPPAPAGWTRTDTSDMAEGMAMMGGGAGAEVNYINADDTSVTISAYADNMMVQSIMTILDNPAVVSMMGGTEDIGGIKFLAQDGSLSGLIDSRIMLQANGDADQVKMLLALFDFTAMAKFDAN